MGWLYSDAWPTRKHLIDYLVADSDYSKTIKHCCVGNNLWMVREHTVCSDVSERFVVLCLMQRRASDVYDIQWGYKDIDETAGPSAVNCPLSYIEMCTEPHNDYSREWRERVRQYHGLRNRKLDIGDIFTYGGWQWKVCDTHGMKGWSITKLPHQGLVYRLHRRQMKYVEDVIKCQT